MVDDFERLCISNSFFFFLFYCSWLGEILVLFLVLELDVRLVEVDCYDKVKKIKVWLIYDDVGLEI